MPIEQSRTTWTASRIVGLFDHAILQPTYTDDEIRQQLAALRRFPIASVCVKPYAVVTAVDALIGTEIAVGTVIGFPHGSALPEIKAREAAAAFRDGAAEVDMVVNVGKVLSGDWDYVRNDIGAVLEVTRRHNGVIKVIFETDFISADPVKIHLCEICAGLKVDFVKTSTGFGFLKRPDGAYSYTGASEHDVKLMRRHCPPEVGVKPSAAVRTLDRVLTFVKLGATRIGTASTATIYAEALERFGE